MDARLLIKRVLVDGVLLSVLLSIVIYGSIWLDPLMWVSDYPPDIRAEVGAVDVPLAQTVVAGLLFVGIIAGVGLRSNALLRRQSGGRLSFLRKLEVKPYAVSTFREDLAPRAPEWFANALEDAASPAYSLDLDAECDVFGFRVQRVVQQRIQRERWLIHRMAPV